MFDEPCYRHFLFGSLDPAVLSRARVALAASAESPMAEDLRQVADGIALTTAGLIARQRSLERWPREQRGRLRAPTRRASVADPPTASGEG